MTFYVSQIGMRSWAPKAIIVKAMHMCLASLGTV